MKAAPSVPSWVTSSLPAVWPWVRTLLLESGSHTRASQGGWHGELLPNPHPRPHQPSLSSVTGADSKQGDRSANHLSQLCLLLT